MTNFAANIEQLVRRRGWSGRVAFYTDGRSWSHGEVHDTAARAATVLRRRGVAPGDRVLIAAPDGIGWVIGFLAVARLGATVVPVNPDLGPREHLYMVEDCDSRLVVTTERLADRFGPCLTVDRMLDEAATAERCTPVPTSAPLYVHYTSGTTGRPKGVVHPPSNPYQYYRAVGQGCFGLTPREVTLSVSKLYFTYGFCNAFVFPLFSGSAAVLVPVAPAPGLVEELVARYQVSWLYAVPSWFARLTSEESPKRFGSVRAAVSGGERLPKDMALHAGEVLGAPVLNQLGATEIGCAATANTPTYDRPGTIGRAVPGFRLEIRGAEGHVLGPEAEGDLWVRGPVIMTGYLDRPEDTARVLVDGWLHTRDRVIGHADGTYTHLARTDDLQMVGGITMSPMEVEDILRTHPAVLDVAVAAIPDQQGASKLRAFVVPTTAPAADGLGDELIALARGRLAPFKVPRSVTLVAALPRTATGKLRRFLLGEYAEAPLHTAINKG